MAILDKLKKFGGGLVEKIKGKVEESKDNKKSETRLRKAQEEFTKAKSQYDISLMDDREKIYIGTHGVDVDVNDTRTPANGRKKANNVVNVAYELVESQIDTTIPSPSVNSKRKNKEYLEMVIEDSIKNDLLESNIYRINDENERTTPVQGFSIITVNWNPDFEHHLYRGEIELDNNHPKTLIPQPGVYDLYKMDYFFLVSSVSQDYVLKRYGKDLSDEGEMYPEYSSIDGNSDNANDTDNLTVITKWYKDKDGNVGKFTWCNDETLEDFPNYFARRIDGKIEEYEELLYDYTKFDGTVIPAGTKVKYFTPRRYPVILRKNVPVPFYFGGQSDIDVIRDQADAIKKVVSTIEEKILRGGVIIKAKNGHKFNLSNNLYQIVRGEMDELSTLGAVDLQANIQQDMQFYQDQYRAAKDTLGITDAFQGKPDPSARSYVAKQLQVYQASGRMQSKAFNKKKAFKELFEVIFEFKLAFYDEIRPFMKHGTNGQAEYGQFCKYDFLEQDDSGEWYYNTDFLFSAEAGEGIPKDKMWLMNQTMLYAQQGLLNKEQFWAAMERLGYPSATDYKQQAAIEMQQQQQMMQQQAQMAQQQMEQQQAEKQQEVEMDRMDKETDMQMKAQESESKRNIELIKLAQEQFRINGEGKKGKSDEE